MKVYVTGHDGFVGTHLCRKLKELNYDIITASIDELDLKNQPATSEFFNLHKPDMVFHCAAIVGGIGANIKYPYKFLYDNLQIQNNVINSCLNHNVKKVLFLGSSCIYPKDYRQPLVEEDLLQADLEPTNEGYALAKIAGLKLCEYANRTQDTTKFICLMPSNLYGPGDNFNLETAHVIPSLIKKISDAKKIGNETVGIWGSGNTLREFLFVKDVVDGMVWAITNLEKTETFLNIGTGIDTSIKEIIYMIADAVGYEGEFIFDTTKPDGMMRRCLDVSKINKLGWKYKTSLKEGIKKTIEWYYENY